MITKNRLIVYIPGGFLFSLDQTLKYLARTNQETVFVWKKIIGFEYYENNGVAFNLPLPNSLVILLTPIIIFGMIAFFLKNKNNNFLHNLGATLIILGATSNYIDRILFGITIDYIRLFTSIINLADLMIITGVILLILKSKHSKFQTCLPAGRF